MNKVLPSLLGLQDKVAAICFACRFLHLYHAYLIIILQATVSPPSSRQNECEKPFGDLAPGVRRPSLVQKKKQPVKKTEKTQTAHSFTIKGTPDFF